MSSCLRFLVLAVLSRPRCPIGIVDPGHRVTEMNEDNNGRYWVITTPRTKPTQ